jgi:LysM repeat protein
VGDEVKVQLDGLIQETQQLKGENQRLTEENRRLREQLSLIQPGQPLRDTRPVTQSPTGSTAVRNPVPSTSTRASRTYTIQKGDTYYSIARRYNIKPTALEAANPGVDPNRLSVGQSLVVPGP